MSAAGKAWDGILARFAPLFTTASLAIFLRMSSAWALTPGRRTITAVYQVAEPTHERAHDAYHRFFREGAWSMTEMWKEEALMLVKAVVTEFVPEGGATAETTFDGQTHFSALMRLMRSCPQPIIAVVHGPAMGAGLSFALAADVRLASEDSFFCAHAGNN